MFLGCLLDSLKKKYCIIYAVWRVWEKTLCQDHWLKTILLVNYSEAGTVIYIQKAQDEICENFSGQKESPIVQAVMTCLDAL